MDLEANLVKSGETQIYVGFHRNRKGLSFTVKTTSQVEEFMKSMGTGEIADIRVSGRHWVPARSEDILRIYSLTPRADGPATYRLDRPGQPIFEPSGELGRPLVNLSFLRLVGTSEGNGVTFYVKGVYTMEAIKAMRDAIIDASRSFYISYLKPIEYSVQVISQEIPV